MTARWILAALHLIALGSGLGAVWARARCLSGVVTSAGLREALYADTWWGVSAVLWIATGALRAFGGFEKGTQYYSHNSLFLAKMSMLLAILLLELSPMIGLIRWRMALRRGETVDTSSGRRFAIISTIQPVLVLFMVLAAAGMARGFGEANE